MPLTNFPNGVTSYGIPVMPSGVPIPNKNGKVLFVDGTNGADGNKGTDPSLPVATIARAVALAKPHDVIYVYPKTMAQTDTDPGSYAEAITISVPQLSIIGVSHGRTQGGLPQMKPGSGSSPVITVSAPGVMIANMGINGAGSTGGGIKFTDDGGATKASFGASVMNCHFKNCAGSSATDSRTGGAISISGAPWQMLISGNRFYKNVGNIVLLDTSNAAMQDLVIEDNVFGAGASNDSCIYLAAGSGVTDGLVIRNNAFGTFPSLGGGSVATYMNLTGCTGVLENNMFGSTGKTFGAAANVLVPTTVRMANNYQEAAAGASGEIGRT